ncbi:MAG: hypothetical protein H6644_09710 [Caldilineaceae bacterium]|nr:hypothetical protein [Caldilineaceae bacterium]
MNAETRHLGADHRSAMDEQTADDVRYISVIKVGGNELDDPAFWRAWSTQ